MTFLKPILLVLFSAIAYGIAHDLITANICIEYFTVGHPKVIESESPFALALVWGIIATWWLALPMGILIAVFSRAGKLPKASFHDTIRLVTRLLIVMAGLAFVAGMTGYFLAKSEAIYLVPRLAQQVDESRHSCFLAVGWSHGASYLSGTIGTAVVCALLFRQRKKMRDETAGS